MKLVMKKCLLMFALLITALLLAVFTDVKKDSGFDREIGIGKDLTENSMSAIERRDSIR